MENTQELGYVSEKLFAGVLAETVPVYFGAPDVGACAAAIGNLPSTPPRVMPCGGEGGGGGSPCRSVARKVGPRGHQHGVRCGAPLTARASLQRST